MGRTVYGILQARMLEWVAISFSRGSSQLRSSSKAKALLQAGPFGQNGLWSRDLATPVRVLGRRRREVSRIAAGFLYHLSHQGIPKLRDPA